MTRLLSIFIAFFGAALAALGYLDQEWFVAAFGCLLTAVGLIGLTLKE